MSQNLNANNLIPLLGKNRNDKEVEKVFHMFEGEAVVTVDKEDDADDEYVEIKSKGVGFYFEKNVLLSVFLHSPTSTPDYMGYELSLPLELQFNQSKEDVVGLLGSPACEGGGEDGFFGHVPCWVKYKEVGYYLHVEFAMDGESIRMVTLEFLK